MAGYAAVVLAGGRASRLGGVDKPSLPVAGVPLLHRVLAAVANADPGSSWAPRGAGCPPGCGARGRSRPAQVRSRPPPPGWRWSRAGSSSSPCSPPTCPFSPGKRSAAAAGGGPSGSMERCTRTGSGHRGGCAGSGAARCTDRLAELATGVAEPRTDPAHRGGDHSTPPHRVRSEPAPVWYDCDTEQLLRAAEFAAAGGVGRNPGGGRAHVESLPQAPHRAAGPGADPTVVLGWLDGLGGEGRGSVELLTTGRARSATPSTSAR